MKPLLKHLLLGIFLLLTTTTTTQAYNYSWSTHEDIVKPDKDPDCPAECCDEGCEGPPCEAERTNSPVYMKTGHFTWNETDVVLQGKPSLSLSRGFTSQEPRVGLFGNGWISGYEENAVYYTKSLSGGNSSNHIIFRLSNGLRFVATSQGTLYHGAVAGDINVTEGYYTMLMPKGHKGFKIDDLVFEEGNYFKLQNDIILTLPNGTQKTFSKETGKLLTKIDSNGNTITYAYDDNGRLTRIETQTGNALNFAYNSNGFVSQVTDHTGRVWQYLYDETGNLVEAIDALDNAKTYTYQTYSQSNDSQVYQQLTSIADATNTPIVSVVYSGAKVQSYTEGEKRYTYTYGTKQAQKVDSVGSTYGAVWNDAGIITKRIDPLSHTFETLYDANLSKIGTINKDGTSTALARDHLDRVLTSTDELGQITTYEYTGVNTRPTKITTALGHSTTITYDSTYNPLSITDANGNTQSFKYDSKGNATEIADAKGNKTTIAYNSNNQPISVTNALNSTTTITYDAQGRQSTITDAEGRVTTYEYDAMDRITKTIDAIGSIVEYSYDNAGRLTSLKDPVANVTRYTYDTYGRVSSELRPDSQTTNYTYNADNTINTIIRRDGKIVTYTYDKAKRPTSQTVDNDTISYNYDKEGNILTATNTTGTVSFIYDDAGKLTKETQLGIDIETSYDKDSNVKTLSFLNKIVNYNRDNTGLATSINDNTFTYDANSIQTKLSYPNNTGETNTFDAVYNIKQIQTANETIDYSQDKTGLITSKNSTSYQYDDIGRLIQAGADSFSYDNAGNNLNDNASYDTQNNQYIQSDSYVFTYDGMGNVESKTNEVTNETTTYTFNNRNQLTSYTKQDENNNTTKTLEYTYDAFNRRVSKTEDNLEQRYLYDGDDIVAILDNANQVIATITHDESIDTALSITNDNGTFYYHRDHQGSIIALTDSSGQVVESFTYDNHYGTIVSHTKDVETNNPYGYTGRELDTEELYYYRARYYDATVQRFIGEDPIGFSGGDFNFYRYVSGDPVNFIDPSGLFTNNSSVPIEIRPEDDPHQIIPPGKSYTGPIDGFRVPVWNHDWIKVPNPANESCNVNADGTPDVPWYSPEFHIPIHRAPGQKPADYNWGRGGFW